MQKPTFLPGFGDSISTLPLYLDNRVKDKLAQCFVSYDGWDRAMNDTYIIQHSKSSHSICNVILTCMYSYLVLGLNLTPCYKFYVYSISEGSGEIVQIPRLV